MCGTTINVDGNYYHNGDTGFKATIVVKGKKKQTVPKQTYVFNSAYEDPRLRISERKQITSS